MKLFPTIKPPNNCIFIHGVRKWNKNKSIGFFYPEISISLHEPGYTIPVKPYGFILKLYNGAIIKSFDKDVTSKYNENYQKIFSEQTKHKKFINYEYNLEKLIENTAWQNHNEIWCYHHLIEIVGAYIYKKDRGYAAFIKECNKQNIPIERIK